MTEFDLRAPEFKHPDVKPEEYEFRSDGKIVRKDRWETGMHRIAEALGFNRREGFEIDDVVAAVEARAGLSRLPEGWALHVETVKGTPQRRLLLTHTVDGIISAGEFLPQGLVAAEMLANLQGELE